MKLDKIQLKDGVFCHEYGKLSNGGGYHRYNDIVEHSYNTFALIKEGKLASNYQIENSRMANFMLYILKSKHRVT